MKSFFQLLYIFRTTATSIWFTMSVKIFWERRRPAVVTVAKGFASRMSTAGRRRSQLAILQGNEKEVTMRLHCQPSANFSCFAFEHGTMTRFKSTPRRVKTNHTIITNTITFSQSIIHNSSRETRAEARCFHSGLIISWRQVGGDGVSPSLCRQRASRRVCRRRDAVAPSWHIRLWPSLPVGVKFG